jgi:hypothetical protein
MSSGGEVKLEWWGPGTEPPPASLVWCKFPDHLNPDVPGPKSRPGLVLKVRYATKIPDGRFLVQIAYGTSNLKLDKRPLDFTIGNAATLAILRLPQATRFDLDNILWLPWARPYFEPRNPKDRYSTPTMSVLPESVQQHLRWTLATRDRQGKAEAIKADAPNDLIEKLPGLR